jgi:hypothetical protein
MQLLRRLIALFCSWSLVWAGLAWPTLAFGAYSSVPAPSGYTGSGSARSYARSAASTYSWAAGKVSAATTMNVGGRAVPMTVRFTAAANAAASMAQWLRVNPAVAGGVAVASFLAPIIWDAVAEQWEVPGQTVFVCTTPAPGYACTMAGARAFMCTQGWCAAGWTLHDVGIQDVSPAGCKKFNFNSRRDWDSPGTWYATNVGPTWCGYEEPGVAVPATEEDWDEVEAKPFPNAVPNEIVIPVPVEYPPVLNPQPDGDPGTLRVPLGEPYAVPGTDPLEYRQPAVDIVPSPTLDDPLRVDLQPKNLSPDSPEDGLDDPELVEDGDPAEEPGVDLPPSKLCEDFPDISACANLGDAPADAPIPVVVKEADLSETVSFGPDTAACPADRVMSTNLAGDLHFSWAGACTFADGIRPVVIGLAYLGAVGSFFGFGRRD